MFIFLAYFTFPSVYSCHLFLKISSASVRSIQFLSFIEPIFAWNVPLVSLTFLKISNLSHSIVFFYFFVLITEESFLTSNCFSLELCVQMGISFLFCFASCFFSQIFVRPPQITLCLFSFLFLGDGFDHGLLYRVMNLCLCHSLTIFPLIILKHVFFE